MRIFVVSTVLLVLAPTASVAADTPSGELVDPSTPPSPEPLAELDPATDFGAPPEDRALLAMAGIGVGLATATALGAITLGVSLGASGCCGFGPLFAGFAVAIGLTVLSVPASIFLFGNMGGRGADFIWTFLGGLGGAAIGGSLIGLGAIVDENNSGDPGWLYALGAVVGGLGLFAGSITAFELSSRRSRGSATDPEVELSVTLGGLQLSGRF